jgi:hypothetical protein
MRPPLPRFSQANPGLPGFARFWGPPFQHSRHQARTAPATLPRPSGAKVPPREHDRRPQAEPARPRPTARSATNFPAGKFDFDLAVGRPNPTCRKWGCSHAYASPARPPHRISAAAETFLQESSASPGSGMGGRDSVRRWPEQRHPKLSYRKVFIAPRGARAQFAAAGRGGRRTVERQPAAPTFLQESFWARRPIIVKEDIAMRPPT